jgi:hypothetical protein
MTAPYPVLVIHRQLRWEVSNHGLVRPRLDWLCTKERALDHAFEIARESGAEVVAVENAFGTVTELVAVPRQLARAV